MPKDTKTLGNNKARACESLGFVHKKGCASVLTQPLVVSQSKVFVTLGIKFFVMAKLHFCSYIPNQTL